MPANGFYMSQSETSQPRLRVAHLNPNKPTGFTLRPNSDDRAALAAEFGLLDLPALSFQGQIRASGSDSWDLQGTLQAQVVQPCIVTLQPVATTIDEPIQRRFSPHVAQPEGEEVEMPDDELEPLGQFIDLAQIMAEELALALPLYPRAEGVALDESPEPAPETRRPFADLAEMMKRKT